MRPAGALGFAAVIALGGCHRPPALPPAVAFVGHQAIRAPELEAELDLARRDLVPRRDPSEPAVAPGPQELHVLRRTVLDELIDRRLLLAQARQAGITVTAAEVDQALAARRESSSQTAATKGNDPPEPASARLRKLTHDELVIDRFLVRQVAARVAVTPDEERSYYDAHPDAFTRPEEVRCSQIFVARREDAQALKLQLARGADFASLAKAQSTSSDRTRGGDLGWFGHGQMPPELEQACFALQKGQTSDVVRSPYGFHLLRQTGRRPAALLPFAQVEEQLHLLLTRERVAQAEHDYIEKLRREAGVSLVEAEIDKVP